jgi:hypothetical protein
VACQKALVYQLSKGRIFHISAYQDFLKEVFYQSFVFFGFVDFLKFGCAVNHSMSTRIRIFRFFLQVVSMFNDFTIFKSKDVKSGFWTEKL